MQPDKAAPITGELSMNTICADRIDKSIPDAYRLVTKGDGNGNNVYVLQGYFTWTQDWLTARDDIPFGPLY